jgi:hypothetical protein
MTPETLDYLMYLIVYAFRLPVDAHPCGTGVWFLRRYVLVLSHATGPPFRRAVLRGVARAVVRPGRGSRRHSAATATLSFRDAPTSRPRK